MPKQGKHETPADMDEFLDRAEIGPDEYIEFWGGYWSARDKQSYLESWLGFEAIPIETEEDESAFAAFWKRIG